MKIEVLVFVGIGFLFACSSSPQKGQAPPPLPTKSPLQGKPVSREEQFRLELEQLKLERLQRIKYRIVERELDLKGTRSTRAEGNFIPEVGWPLVELFIEPGLIEDAKGRSYFLVITYEAREWLFLEPGESLELLIDGQREALSSSVESARNMVTTQWGPGILETVSYTVTPGLIRRMASATSIRGKLHGQEGIRDFWFVPANIDNFKKFAAQFLTE